MEVKLNREIVDIKNTPFADYKQQDWVLYFIERFGQYSGDHHKTWVLDQIVRILKNCPIEITVIRIDDDTNNYSIRMPIVSEEYVEWANNMKIDDSGDEVEYDPGVAP